MAHTDIKTDRWLLRHTPSFLRPYILLGRFDRPIGVWLLLLPGLWAITLASGGAALLTAGDLTLMGLFLIGAFTMRAAGCTINDLWDRNLDKEVERTRARPLASGQLKVRNALFFLVILLATGLAILLQLSPVAILLGCMIVPFIAIYPAMKRLTWWPQLFLGLVFNFSALIGWAAVSGVLSLPALLLYTAGIFWTLAYDTIYAHQDKEDDARIGIKSTALKFGAQSRRWVAGFYLLFFTAIAAAFVTAQAGSLSLLCLTLPAGHIFWLFHKWDEADPASSLHSFKANKWAGFLIFLAALV